MKNKIERILGMMLIIFLVFPANLLFTFLNIKADGQGVIYRETFVSDEWVFIQSGNVHLAHVHDVDFSESGSALALTRRSNDFDAVDVMFYDLDIKDGYSYEATVTGYVDEDVDVPIGAEAVLSLVDSYTWISNKPMVAGESFTLKSGFTADTSANDRIRVQSNEAAATTPFYVTEIVVEEIATGEPDPDVEEAPDREVEAAFDMITFEDGDLNGFEPRGPSETLTVTDETNRTSGGSYALKVEDRTESWNGPALRIESFIDQGHEYEMSVWVKLIEPGNADVTLSSQIGSAEYGAAYNNIQSQTISTDDDWVELSGTYRFSSLGDDFVTLYVESGDPNASFYIDDVSFSKIDSEAIELEQGMASLKSAYEDYFLIGNAVSTTEFEGDRLELLTQHHNLVTAENAMKPEGAYDNDGNFDFSGADNLVELSLEHGFDVHGHVLVWHQQSPEWLWADEAGGPLLREEALDNLREHIVTNVEHYGDRVISWDVVNEAMQDSPPNPEDWEGSLRQSGWFQAIGPDYIAESFKIAKEVIDENGWDIKLYYNDYNDDNQQKAEAIYQMVKAINEDYAAENDGELLIDGIGMQGHYNLNTNPENVRLSLEKFASLGVEVGVTELDITAGSNSEQTEEEMQQQAYLYARLFEIYKDNHEHVSRVTFWGLDDASSWRADQSPLLFDRDMQAKPAYHAVIDPEGFLAEYEALETVARSETAKFGSPTIDGEIDTIWNEAPVLPINQYQGAWHGASGEARVMWDHDYLYVLVEVTDTELDKTADQPFEQDSVEVFIEESNQKSTFYQDGDGHYRVNYDNEATFSPDGIDDGFESATTIDDSNYIVEMKIPFKTVQPKEDLTIGFDIQINDAADGARQSVATWNDLSGTAYEDPSVLGNLTLGEEGAVLITEDSSDHSTLYLFIAIGVVVLVAGAYALYDRKNKKE